MDRLLALGAKRHRIERHRDEYFQHPSRDFGATDEALRIRSVDDDSFITYKGRRLSGTVKIRPEIETPLAPNTRADWHSILCSLGFDSVAIVEKSRTVYELAFHSQQVTIAYDDAGPLGTFAELELIVQDSARIENATQTIELLAEALSLTTRTTKSYLKMHMEAEKTN